MNSNSRRTRCVACDVRKGAVTEHANTTHRLHPSRLHSSTRVDYIANNPALASIEIKALRGKNAKLMRMNAQKLFLRDLKVNGKLVDAKEFTHVKCSAIVALISLRTLRSITWYYER